MFQIKFPRKNNNNNNKNNNDNNYNNNKSKLVVKQWSLKAPGIFDKTNYMKNYLS